MDSDFDSLILTFNDLEILKLTEATGFNGGALNTKVKKNLKSALLQTFKKFILDLRYQSFLLDLSNFIKINGKKLGILKIGDKPIYEECLGAVIQSIGKYYESLQGWIGYAISRFKITKITRLFFGYKNTTNGGW